MTIHVALFRGINVGGKHILPMQDLRELLAELGCEDIQTYIQSGNAVFSTTADVKTLSDNIRASIDEKFGFAPQVLVLTANQFRDVAAANPFANAEADPKTLHVAFLTEDATDPDLDALTALKAESEEFSLTRDAFYLSAPDGIGRSRLVAKIDQYLGVSTTSRNWRTVRKLLALLD